MSSRLEIDKSKNLERPEVPSISELVAIVEDICDEFSTIYLIVDAINESKQSSQMLHSLFGLAQDVDGLKIMISSTEEVSMPSTIQITCPVMVVVMDTKYVDLDIEQYVESWLRSNERLQGVPSTLKSDIMSKLIDQADGS